MAASERHPTAEVLVSFYDGATEDGSTTIVNVRHWPAPWRPVAELVEEARQSTRFLPAPFAEAYRACIEDASLLVRLLRAGRGTP